MAAAPDAGLSRRVDVAAYLFNAAGRSSRAGYLPALVVTVVLVQPLNYLEAGVLRALYGWVIGFLAYVIWATATARRLHDLGLAGWWVALLSLAAWLAPTTAVIQPWIGAGFGLLAVAAQVVLLLWPGQGRFNRFGPQPA